MNKKQANLLTTDELIKLLGSDFDALERRVKGGYAVYYNGLLEPATSKTPKKAVVKALLLSIIEKDE